VVEQGRLAGGLRPEDGDQVVVEAGLGDAGLGEVVIEIRAAERVVVLAGCLAVLPSLADSMAWMGNGGWMAPT
jgi:hypothetical protein